MMEFEDKRPDNQGESREPEKKGGIRKGEIFWGLLMIFAMIVCMEKYMKMGPEAFVAFFRVPLHGIIMEAALLATLLYVIRLIFCRN